MAVKTFASGEVLTASDTNTYLNNGGLVYINEFSATSGTTIDLTNVFSATYDAYRVVISDFRTAAGASIIAQFLASGSVVNTNYAWSFMRADMAGTYLGAGSGTGATTSSWATQITTSTNAVGAMFDVFNPYLAQYSYYVMYATDNRGITGYGAQYGTGVHQSATSYASMRLTLSASSFTNIKVRVYGYRQA